MERDKRTDLGRLGEVKDNEDLRTMTPERFKELVKETGLRPDFVEESAEVSEADWDKIKTTNMYTVCRKTVLDAQPLTLKALQDALIKLGDVMRAASMKIQPMYLVMDPKTAKSYIRRSKRRRHRDDKLFVCPTTSFYRT